MKKPKTLIPLFLALLGLALAAFLIGKHMNRSPLTIDNNAIKEAPEHVEISADVYNDTDKDIAAQLVMKLLQKVAHEKGTFTFEPIASKLANVFVPKNSQVHVSTQIVRRELPPSRSNRKAFVSEVFVEKIYETKAKK